MMYSDQAENQPIMAQCIKDASVEIRNGFIRKVYFILSVQLLLTVVIAAPLSTMSVEWVHRNKWLFYLSIAMTLITICSMACCHGVARQYPTNYCFLFIFTGFEGVMVGFLSAMYTWQSVVLAAGITVAVFLALTAYAFLSKTDFTGFGPYLFGALFSLSAVGLVIIILNMCGVNVHWLIMLYDLIGVLIFVFYIIYDTQLIIGGHKFQFSIDDYAFAALSLYLDIINLFIHILELFGQRR